MAVTPLYLDGRIFKRPTANSNGTSLQNLENAVNLLTYIQLVVAQGEANTEFDTISEFTSGHGTTFTTKITANAPIIGAVGTVSLPEYTFTGDLDTGIYHIGANNIGVAVSGAKVLDVATTGLAVTGVISSSTTLTAGTGLITDSITEKTSGAGITLSKALIRKTTATAVNSTGAITAAQLAGGLITSTSAAGVTATLPTASLLATQLGAVQGTIFEFIVDNSAGANTVTVAVNTGITVGTTAVTGGDTLTVSTANVAATFRLVFTSATTAILRRIS